MGEFVKINVPCEFHIQELYNSVPVFGTVPMPCAGPLQESHLSNPVPATRSAVGLLTANDGTVLMVLKPVPLCEKCIAYLKDKYGQPTQTGSPRPLRLPV